MINDTDGQRWADSSPYQNALHELAELRAQLADTSACANMLALNLECLLMDTADLSVQSRWWDSSMQSLVAWQNLDDQPHVSPLGVD